MGNAKKKNKKKNNRPANQRPAKEGSTSSSGGGWTGPIIMLVVGLVAIAWAGGFIHFGSESTQGTDASSASSNSSVNPGTGQGTTRKPQLLTDSAEIAITDVETWRSADDPERDGWDSEALHLTLKKPLKKLGNLLIHPEKAIPEKLAPLLTDDFSASRLRPKTLETTFRDKAILVERGTFALSDDDTVQGAEGLATLIGDLTGSFQGAKDARHQFKVIRVDHDEDSAQTEQLLSLSGHTDKGFFEQHATWVIDWKIGKNTKPKMKSIQATKFEQSLAQSGSPVLLADCTESALGHNETYREQLLRSVNYWLQRSVTRTAARFLAVPGIAIADVNGDGLEDLYLSQDPGIPNRLFLQNADGTATEASAAWGVDWLEDSRGAVFVDMDNDGDQDLILAVQTRVVLIENVDQKRFRLVKALETNDDLLSVCVFDYDNDGRLDLYCYNYQVDTLSSDNVTLAWGSVDESFESHDANNGSPNSMYRNVTKPGEEWAFEDVTEAVGLDVNNSRWSFSASAEDYDNDGDLDLYVANDYGRDNLYRNDQTEDGQTKFVSVDEESKIENSSAGMAISWGDYNCDGWMDVYTSAMWSSASQRITSKARFRGDRDEQSYRRYQRFGAGNSLMKNQGDGTFVHRSAEANAYMGRWAWGNVFFDINNDGWQDLAVANGYVTADDTGDL